MTQLTAALSGAGICLVVMQMFRLITSALCDSPKAAAVETPEQTPSGHTTHRSDTPDVQTADDTARVVNLGAGRPYGAPLINGGERALLDQLLTITKGYAVQIAPKVRVLDVVGSDNDRLTPTERAYAFNAHFDFTVVYRNTMTPILVVELDGQHHEHDRATQRRDALKDQLCVHVNLPMIRVKFGWWGGLLPVQEALDRYFSLPASTELYRP